MIYPEKNKMDYNTWLEEQLLLDLRIGLRVGQSYMVRVNRSLSDIKLFNETNDSDAMNRIQELEKDKE